MHRPEPSLPFFGKLGLGACLGFDASNLYASNMFARKPRDFQEGLFSALKRFVGSAAIKKRASARTTTTRRRPSRTRTRAPTRWPRSSSSSSSSASRRSGSRRRGSASRRRPMSPPRPRRRAPSRARSRPRSRPPRSPRPSPSRAASRRERRRLGAPFRGAATGARRQHDHSHPPRVKITHNIDYQKYSGVDEITRGRAFDTTSRHCFMPP